MHQRDHPRSIVARSDGVGADSKDAEASKQESDPDQDPERSRMHLLVRSRISGVMVADDKEART